MDFRMWKCGDLSSYSQAVEECLFFLAVLGSVFPALLDPACLGGRLWLNLRPTRWWRKSIGSRLIENCELQMENRILC